MHKLDSKLQHKLQKMLNKLKLYPLVIFISWTVVTFADNLSASPNFESSFPGDDVYNFMVQFLPCSQGFLTGFVFLFTCTEVRTAWYVLLTTGSYTNATKCLKPHVVDHVRDNAAIALVPLKRHIVISTVESNAGDNNAETNIVDVDVIPVTQTQASDIVVFKFAGSNV